MKEPLDELVSAWISGDVDESDQEELRSLARRAHSDETALTQLKDRFSHRLQFGTAGLRGVMAAGPNAMNRAVVIQATHGLVTYLQAHIDQPKIVIGNDARHHSRQFALDTAGVITAAGGEAILLDDPVPTPLLSFSVRHLEADAGVMVTASHNPAADNGFKVYLGGRMVDDHARGVQIVSPHDAGIAECIDAAPHANLIPRAEGWACAGGELRDTYLQAISQGQRPPAPIRIVYTAMHGVGADIALAAFQRAGFDSVTSVQSQLHPDPEFPTVAFPNPEEPGALDQAIALAQREEADIVIAHDPDADRCAVALEDPRLGWRILHGDELGAVLGEDLATSGCTGVFANSVVSSRQLEVIAIEHGNEYVQTLTGFKWMGRVEDLGFAYEEAIGYCVRPDLVRDKDGITTGVMVARLASRLKAQGSSIMGLLDDLARRHGLYLSSQLSVRFDDQPQIPLTMDKLRISPLRELASSPVELVADLQQGWKGLPPTDGILMKTRRDDQVIVRPSGTEPKVKCYLEVIEPVSPEAGFEELSLVRTRAAERLTTIKEDLSAALFA
ncbi:MAG: phospho-sugar mutase [Propionibacteriaceae bacterium]|nr:phospho-sugar mutase [Propionibacteriaceae bacterium]